MATPIRIKRSAVSGKKPQNTDLQVGELALNTYDGSLFTKRDTGGVGIATTVSNITPWVENFGGTSINYSSGNVGIGSDNPTSKLDVNGSLNVSGVSTLGSGASAQVFLQYGGSTKLKTQSWGVQATGTIQAISGRVETANVNSQTEGYSLKILNSNGAGGVKSLLEVGHSSNNSFITGHVGNISINAPTVAISTNMTVGGIVTATSFESTVSTGTAPFVVASTTKVTNLNADLLDGKSTANGAAGNTVVVRNAAAGFSAADVNFQSIVGTALSVSGISTFNGGVGIADSIFNIEHTNTAIRFLTEEVAIETAGTERLRIDSDGKIGIGTNNPDAKLHVYQNAGDSVITIESQGNGNHSALEFVRTSSAGDSKGAGSIYVTGDTSASEAIMHFGVGHNISHGQVPRLSIKGDGEVGIGSTIPSEKLDVAGHIKVDGGPVLETSGTFNPGGALKITSPSGYVEVGAQNTSYAHFITDRGRFYFSSEIIVDEGKVGSYNEDLVLATNVNDERIRIKNDDGHVGIGTTNPTAPLHIFRHVADNVGVTTLLTLHSNRNDMTSSYVAGGSIRFLNDDGNHGGEAFIEVNAPSSHGTSEAAREKTVDFNLKQTNDGTLNTTLTIKGETGDVGIGTNAPGSKLDVLGDIRVGSKIELGQFPGASFLDLDDDNQPTAFPGGTNNVTLASISGINLIYDSNNNDGNGLVIAHGNPNSGIATAVLVVDENGKVGIGTHDPNSLLSLYSDAADDELLHFDMGSPTQRRGWKFKQGSTGTGTQLILQADENGKVFQIQNSSGDEQFYVYTAVSDPYVRVAGNLVISDTIEHTGDDNTKIRFPAEDTISFETAGSERVRIDSSGNLFVTGIATFDQNVSIGGTLTYEDVTNVDSIGIITARSGINVSNGNIVGDNATNISGINSVTATSFYGLNTGNASLILDAGTGGAAGSQVSFIDFKLDGTLKGNIAMNEGGDYPGSLEINSSGTGATKIFDSGSEKLSTTSTGINVTGILTATSFSGSGASLTGLTGASSGTYGNSTSTPVITVDGNGRITTISTASISGGGGGGGGSIAGINTTGTSVFNTLDIGGDIDVDGHTELDNLNVAGVSTFNGDLTISEVSPAILFNDTTGTPSNPDYRLQANNGEFIVYDETNAATRVAVGTDGKVGIGTASPAYTLDFGKSSASTIRLISEQNGTAIRIGPGDYNHDVTLLRVDGKTDDHMGESNNSSYGFSLKYMGSRSGNNNSFSLFADDSEGTQFEAITVLQDGKVGIGTDSPDVPLHVFDSTSNNIALFESGDAFGALGISDSNGSVSLITTLGKLLIKTGGDAGTLGTNSDTAMVIEGGGDVGIGTDNPNSKLHVLGDARITGILTVGESSLKLDGDNNIVNVGTALTLGHDQGIQFHTQNLHASGFEVNQINATGIITATTFKGALTGNATGLSGTPSITVQDIEAEMVSIGGTLTYEDVTNINSIGIVTARQGIHVIGAGSSVGIGTTNPKTALHVVNGVGSGYTGTFNARTSAIIDGDDSAGTTLSIISKASGFSGLFFGRPDSEARGQIHYVHSNDSFRILTNAGGDDALRIKSDNKVGISTNDPQTALDIFATPIESATINTTNSTQLGLWVRAKNPSNTTGNIYTGITLGEGRAGLYAYDDGGSAAHGMGFWTGSNSGVAERLRITSTGELISTNGTLRRNVSDSSFTVSGDTASNTGANINLYGASHASLANVFRVRTGSTERLRIDSSGRLIIGGTSAGPYHADGDNLNLYSTGNTGLTVFSGTSSLGSLFFADDNNDEYGQRRGAIQYNHDGNYLAFWTNAGEKLRIKSDGKVGIGTINPDEALHIQSGSPVIKFSDGTLNSFIKGDGSELKFISGGTTKDFMFQSSILSSSEVVRITGDGKVGIGTNDPTATLDVDGSLDVSGNIKTSGNHILLSHGFTSAGITTIGDYYYDKLIINSVLTASLKADYDAGIHIGESGFPFGDGYFKGNITGFNRITAGIGSTHVNLTVTVSTKHTDHRYYGSGSSNAYVIDGVQSPFFTFTPGRKYRFDQSDSSNSGHPLRFFLEADKTTPYTTNVTTSGTPGAEGGSAYTEIEVTDETPTILHYQCNTSGHNYMGNAFQTNSNVVNTNYDSTIRGNLNVSGIVTAQGARFTDDGTDSPIVSIQTDDANPNGLNIGNQTYSSNTAFGLNLYSNNDGEGYFRHVANAAYKDYHFYLHDNTTAKLCLKFEADDQSAELYAGGSKKLETTTSGAVVTGILTATSFVKSGGTSSQYLMADGSVTTGGGGGGGVTVKDEGSALSTTGTTLNFVGNGVVASGTGAEKTITISGGGSGVTVQDEGSDLSTLGTTLNFVGSGVVASGTGAVKTITISGGGGGTGGKFVENATGIHTLGNVGVGTTNASGAILNISTGAGVTDTVALDIQGTEGSLFSVTNNLTSGSLFSINDVSGIPAFDYNANGNISMGAFADTVAIGKTSSGVKLGVKGSITEGVHIVANKLSAAPNINVDNGNVHLFTTNETTTATPNVTSTVGLNTSMDTGDTLTVVIISKPNNAGYYAELTIDGVAQTEEWLGGNAPSSASSDGYDVNTYNIIKTGSATYIVLANTVNFSN